MTVRQRLTSRAAAEAVAQVESVARARPALLERLQRLRAFLAASPGDAVTFSLLAAAKAVGTDAQQPLTAFREFRRTVNAFAAEQGIDLVLVADGRKRAPATAREWWIEGTDSADRKLTELSVASIAAVTQTPVVPARGRNERDGKTVVRTFFDFAPADAVGVERCIGILQTRLDTDREYIFEPLPAGRTGDDVQAARRRALAEADLVVAFLSPSYLNRGLVEAKGRVAPLCWSRLARGATSGGTREWPSSHTRPTTKASIA